jgi:uncharacterized membrane protein
MWAGLAFMGLSLLFWVGITGLVVWAVMRWVAPRMRVAPAMMGAATVARPSAMEALAHRYATGEIDTTTFEMMAERIIASEGRGRTGEPPTPPREGDVYNT